jgi:hypothetical protein
MREDATPAAIRWKPWWFRRRRCGRAGRRCRPTCWASGSWHCHWKPVPR